MVTKTNTKPAIAEPTKQEILAPELERIRLEHDGILRPEDVVTEAEPEESPLHNYFQWDDSEAAVQYRLWQARQLISVVVVTLPNSKHPIEAYVSLKDDRTNGGGYLSINAVLSDPIDRQRLLTQALDDLKYWERRYKRLHELSEIYHAIAMVRSKYKRN